MRQKKKLNPIQKYAKKNPSGYSKQFLNNFASMSGLSKGKVAKLAKAKYFTKPENRIY